MPLPNVVLVVVDTLRDDFATGLGILSNWGFQKIDDVVTPSPWTLPSHVSMFTGEMPSVHGVHERSDWGLRELMSASRQRLGSSKGLLKQIANLGYTTHCLTANPFISLEYGFQFDHYGLNDRSGEISTEHSSHTPFYQDRIAIPGLLYAGLHSRSLRDLMFRAFNRLVTANGLRAFDKGSRHILAKLANSKFEEPFFLFVNFMEAHEPYAAWNGIDLFSIGLSVLGKPPRADWFAPLYGVHSNLAVRRTLEAVRNLMRYDPIIIVTSDHGQLIGEGGRFSHGYSLDDVLLKVPFYIRFPKRETSFVQSDRFVSLTDVPSIVYAGVSGRSYAGGHRYAAAECWGGQHHSVIRKLLKVDPKSARLFEERTKVYANAGSVLFNRDSGAVEEARGLLSDEELSQIASSFFRKPQRESSALQDGSSSRDERLILDRLRQLGYE